MALYHRATITPPKAEVVATWATTQAWCPDGEVSPVGAFRFDDPLGAVGMETHIAAVGDALVQVPLTYRDAPLADDAGLITTIEHSALGTRWVYDGLADPIYVTMLTAVSLTGQGEALGLVEVDGRWIVAPTNVRISGGGGGLDRVAVDAMVTDAVSTAAPTFANDRFEMTVHRQLRPGSQPPIGLTAMWDGLSDRVVLTEVTALS